MRVIAFLEAVELGFNLGVVGVSSEDAYGVR